MPIIIENAEVDKIFNIMVFLNVNSSSKVYMQVIWSLYELEYPNYIVYFYMIVSYLINIRLNNPFDAI